MYVYVLTKKEAFTASWQLFWFATGSRRIGVVAEEDKLELIGDALLTEVLGK